MSSAATALITLCVLILICALTYYFFKLFVSNDRKIQPVIVSEVHEVRVIESSENENEK
tara:strand:- start:102 stop:278 length:177 start_codon:yes stop_codon:yes gene_type:complete